LHPVDCIEQFVHCFLRIVDGMPVTRESGSSCGDPCRV
jgi:hypothetical protein